MPNMQVLRGVPATVGVDLLDQNGQPRSGGAVSVEIVRSDGSVLIASRSAEQGAQVGRFETTLTPAETSLLDDLTARWTESGATYETEIQVVGGYYFTLDEARKAGPNLTDSSKFPDELVISARRFVEEECERITGRAFVPRFEHATLSGSDDTRLRLPRADIRRIRSLGIRDGNRNLAYLNDDGLDALHFDAAGRIVRTAFGSFPYGSGNVEVAYEYGLGSPPQQIKSAALLRVRDVLKQTKTGAPDSATFQIIEGRVFGIPQPGVRGSRTGINEVDAAYDAWSFRRGSTAAIPYG